MIYQVCSDMSLPPSDLLNLPAEEVAFLTECKSYIQKRKKANTPSTNKSA